MTGVIFRKTRIPHRPFNDLVPPRTEDDTPPADPPPTTNDDDTATETTP